MFISITLIIASYLLGSIPFALVIGKGIYGVDVRGSGSGNIGTTNVFRVLGKKAGVMVFIGDMAKGFVPVFLAGRIFELDSAALISVLCAGAAIAGHTWPVYLKFRGGKGVAVGGGTVLALMPLLFLLAFGVFWIVLLAGRMVSVASMTAVTALSLVVILAKQPTPYIVFTLLGTAVIFYAHRSNISRLVRRKENRVTFPWNRKTKRTSQET